MMMFYLVTVLLAIANLGLSASGRSTSSCAVPTQTPGAYSFRPTTDSESVCLELKAAISGVNGTLTPSDGASYEDFEDQNYSALCRLPAACIVNPRSADEVATALKILVKHQTKFAIRSGGHNYIPGFASINETGVLISLSELNSILPSNDKETVHVGPGNRWDAVYKALAPQGLTVIGGRVGPVGVGGLILGGGISYFSSEYGLVFDNVKSFEIVLGNGSVVTTSSDDNADLYKALRGGGSNFGIVTSYELYTYPTGTISMDARAYSINQTDEFLQALAEYQKRGQNDTKSSVTVQILPTGPTVLLLYAGTELYPQAFAPFYDVKPYESLVEPSNNSSMMDVLNLSDSRFVTGDDVRVYGETFSHIADADLLIELFNIFINETSGLPPNVTATWVPNSISPNVAARGRARGGNILGLLELSQVWYESFITYQDPAHDDLVREVTKSFTEKCIAAANARNSLGLPYLFANTAGGRQEALQSYGNESVTYMKSMAAKYDPGCVFQRLQNDGFLIRDV